VNASRAAHWLWHPGVLSGLARVPLLPFSAVYAGAMHVRNTLYRHGLRAVDRLGLPTVAVGNLSVGGTGKTPLATWIAGFYAAQGMRPGILLRGYGGDETLVHQRLVPEAIVVADPDRVAGARHAASRGAHVLVLDDAFQLLRVARDLNIVAMAAEQSEGLVRWVLPAGPWRESMAALARADAVVVTRKAAPRCAGDALVERLERSYPHMLIASAELRLARLERMRSGGIEPLERLEGRHVLAVAGIADWDGFAAQLEAAGARVTLRAFSDHHRYGARDVASLVGAARAVDDIVVTEKDAVKLRTLWPESGSAPEPAVAVLDVRWEHNGAALGAALSAVPTRIPKPIGTHP